MGRNLISVKKGNIFFDPSRITWFFNKTKFSYQIIFTETSLKNTTYDDTGHSEVLFGVMFGFNKDNYAKFSWRPDGDKIMIFACSSSSCGLKSSYNVAKLDTGFVYKFKIRKFNKYYTFSIFDSFQNIVAYYKVKKRKTLFFGKEFF